MTDEDRNLNELLIGVFDLFIPVRFSIRAGELVQHGTSRDEKMKLLKSVLTYLGSEEHLSLFKEIPNAWEIKEKFRTNRVSA